MSNPTGDALNHTRLTAAMNELPPTCLRAFILVRYDGLSITEAASRLHLRRKIVRRFVQRGFAHCQQAIER